VRNNDGVAERIAHPTSRCINSSLKTYAAIFQHAHSMRVVSPSLGPLHAASLLQSRSPSRSRFMLRRLQLPRKVSPLGTQKLVREYIGQAARLRDLAASVTTPRIKARLLEEAKNHEQFAEKAKQGGFHTIVPTFN
jgi:hypothetical protein